MHHTPLQAVLCNPELVLLTPLMQMLDLVLRLKPIEGACLSCVV